VERTIRPRCKLDADKRAQSRVAMIGGRPPGAFGAPVTKVGTVALDGGRATASHGLRCR